MRYMDLPSGVTVVIRDTGPRDGIEVFGQYGMHRCSQIITEVEVNLLDRWQLQSLIEEKTKYVESVILKMVEEGKLGFGFVGA